MTDRNRKDRSAAARRQAAKREEDLAKHLEDALKLAKGEAARRNRRRMRALFVK